MEVAGAHPAAVAVAAAAATAAEAVAGSVATPEAMAEEVLSFPAALALAATTPTTVAMLPTMTRNHDHHGAEHGHLPMMTTPGLMILEAAARGTGFAALQ